MADFWVNGIVSVRDHQPYVQLANEQGMIAQLTMAQVRNIAMDMLQQAARAEADALIWKFCENEGFPPAAGSAMMQTFRDFRAELDQEVVQRKLSDPEGL